MPLPVGPCHQHHAVRLQDGRLEPPQGIRLETQLGHVQLQAIPIEQPQNHLFTMQGGQDRHSKVEVSDPTLLCESNLHAAVLRQALFRDVQLGHDLDSGGHGVFLAQGRGHDGAQETVDAKAHPQLLLVGLDMDVTGPLLQGAGQDPVDQLDDGGFPGGLPQVFHGSGRLFAPAPFGLVAGRRSALDRGACAPLFELQGEAGAIVLSDSPPDGGLGGHHRLDGEACHELQVVHGQDVGGVDGGDRQGCAFPTQRQNLVLAGRLRRNELDDRGVDLEEGEVYGGKAELAAQDSANVLAGDPSQPDQAVSQPASVDLLVLQGLPELLPADDVFSDQQVTEVDRHESRLPQAHPRQRPQGTGLKWVMN